jgi:hypothetical protein
MLFLEISVSIAVVVLFSVVFFSLWPDNTIIAIEPQSIYFGQEINVSKDNGTSELPQVTAEGNNVYVVWQDNTSGNYDIYFAHSPDNGKNFEPVRNLSKDNGTSELAQVTAEGNNVYVVWQGNTSGNYDIYFAHSPDNGKNFEPVRNLSKDNGTSELPQVTAEGNNVYVVWQDNTSGNYDIYFKSSSTNGTKFKSQRNLSKDNGTSELPQIESYKNLFYVVWKDTSNRTDRIFFKEGLKDNSTNAAEFGSLMKVSSKGNISKPELFAGANSFSSVWASNLDIASFIEFYPLNFFDSNNAIQLTRLSAKDNISSVSISGHNTDTYCVWENKKISNGDIFFKRISTKYFD